MHRLLEVLSTFISSNESLPFLFIDLFFLRLESQIYRASAPSSVFSSPCSCCRQAPPLHVHPMCRMASVACTAARVFLPVLGSHNSSLDPPLPLFWISIVVASLLFMEVSRFLCDVLCTFIFRYLTEHRSGPVVLLFGIFSRAAPTIK